MSLETGRFPSMSSLNRKLRSGHGRQSWFCNRGHHYVPNQSMQLLQFRYFRHDHWIGIEHSHLRQSITQTEPMLQLRPSYASNSIAAEKWRSIE